MGKKQPKRKSLAASKKATSKPNPNPNPNPSDQPVSKIARRNQAILANPLKTACTKTPKKEPKVAPEDGQADIASCASSALPVRLLRGNKSMGNVPSSTKRAKSPSPESDSDRSPALVRRTRKRVRRTKLESGHGKAATSEKDETQISTASTASAKQAEGGEPKEIRRIILGKYTIGTWYLSPYPAEYQVKDLYICERCLKYMKSMPALDCHKCGEFPRGALVYSDQSVELYKVDGKEEKLYCQNLCLLSKLFLDQKTIFYDIGSFYFYILLMKQAKGGERRPSHLSPSAGIEVGYSFVGYFSKEKASLDNNNLACILVLPPFRGQNLGQLLIELSYELSKLDCIVGGPEQPLSPQGFHSYRSYWRRAVVSALLDYDSCVSSSPQYGLPNDSRRCLRRRVVSLSTLAKITAIRVDDILFTLHDLGLLEFWSGNHIVCIADESLHRVIGERGIRLAPRVDADGLLVAADGDDTDCPESSGSEMESEI